MSEQFSCSEPTAKMIAEQLSLKEENVLKLDKIYKKIIRDIPYQYLAHIIRTIEEYVRNIDKEAGFFRITCTPIKDNKAIKGLAIAKYHKPYSFDISYDDSMPEIQKRVCIAHELGHLLVSIIHDRNYDRASHEPLSTVYGILITLHKKFCSDTKKTSSSDEEIIKDFKEMAGTNK